MEILLVSIVIGLVPALIAQSKGRSFFAWWVYSALLFIIAFVHSLVIKKDVAAEEKDLIENEGMKTCPFCAEIIKNAAIKCKHCGSDLMAESPPVKTDEEYLEEARQKVWKQ